MSFYAMVIDSNKKEHFCLFNCLPHIGDRFVAYEPDSKLIMQGYVSRMDHSSHFSSFNKDEQTHHIKIYLSDHRLRWTPDGKPLFDCPGA
jgi:hypothetical protein